MLKRKKGDANSAPKHVFNKLKKEARDEFNFDSKDELWMIIDTDQWNNLPEIVDACEKLKNMYVAVSNPCFELWLLLHIKDVSEYSTNELNDIFENKKVSKNRNYIEKKIIDILGTYNKSRLKAKTSIVDLTTYRSSSANLCSFTEGTMSTRELLETSMRWIFLKIVWSLYGKK